MPAIPAAPPRDEVARLLALDGLKVLDTLPEPVYDDLVRLASQICGTPIGLVSLVDRDRQWFKARVGLGATETHRDLAFCAHAIVAAEPVFVVEDAARDPRFCDNPLVTGAPHIRFYAGAPIVLADGHAIGTMCVIDTVPRSLDAAQTDALQALARQASALFELRMTTFAAERSRQALIDSQQRLRVVTDNLPALIAHVDSDERYRFLNAEFERVLGVDVQASLGRSMREIRGETAYALLAPHVAAALRGATTSFGYTEQVDDRSVHYQANYIPDIDAAGQVQGFYSMTFDITELKETQRQLELLARVDALTGLPNRRQFDERIYEAMSRTRRTMRAMVVMFLDIDHFKAINDSLGHAGGDVVLREVARRLKAGVRVTDTVARLAGDEFVVVLEGIDGVLEVGRLADKIVATMRPRFQVVDNLIAVTISVGVAIYRGDDALSASDLLSVADGALYQAKQRGRNRFVIA